MNETELRSAEEEADLVAEIYDIIDGSEDPLHREAKIARIGQWLQFDCDRDACDNVYDLAQAWTEHEEAEQ